MTAKLPSAQPDSRTPASSHLRALGAIRGRELQQALAHFPPTHKAGKPRVVLEIGAGTGQQARSIEEAGYQVVAIDLATSHYRTARVRDVIEYDGRTIPMADGTADVVFSSNVLEHVGEIDAFLDETRRVMAKGGISVHILPSATCRLWSIPAHYIWLARRIAARLHPRYISGSNQGLEQTPPRRPTSTREWLGTFFPLRHGERGSSLTESYYYSRYWWSRKFMEHGFKILKIDQNRIFYTMANAWGDSLDIDTRIRISRYFGSACHIYVLGRHQG